MNPETIVEDGMSLERTQEVMHALYKATPQILEEMRLETMNLSRKLYKTPKWRKIKRYHLFERINKLEEDIGLISHVMLDDQY